MRAVLDLRREEHAGDVRAGFADRGQRGGVVGAQRPQRALDLARRRRSSPLAGGVMAASVSKRGQRSSRLRRRSASTRPPVWQVGQYWKERVASDTSRMVSPHTGHGSPVRPWTVRCCFLSGLRSAMSTPRARSTASPITERSAACRRSVSSAVSAAAWRNGDSRAAWRISSEYALPTPATSDWSASTVLSWPRRWRRRAPSRGRVEAVVEHVDAEPRDAGHVGRPAHHVEREAVLGALLGDVDAAAALELELQRQRPAQRRTWPR